MTPEDALNEARAGSLRPVYLVAGEEQYLAARVVAALAEAARASDTMGLTEERISAADTKIESVLSAARTLPMFSKRRVLVVKGIESWEGGAKGKNGDAFDLLADYVQAPAPSTVLVLAAAKLDKRRRLYTQASKLGCLVVCDALSRGELPRWIARAASERGNEMSRDVAELVAELAGPELSAVSDAVERVCLYVGPGRAVDEEAVAACIVRVRPATVWELVDAVGQRDAGRALALLNDVYDPQDRGLRLVGVLAWNARQLLRFEAALAQGASAENAARRAGAKPFKARDLQAQVRRTPRADLERWLLTLAGVDAALKGGSRRLPKAVLEHALLTLCRAAPERHAGRGA